MTTERPLARWLGCCCCVHHACVQVVFSVSHVVASIVLVQLGGAAGLVAADAVNMGLRIAYSLW